MKIEKQDLRENIEQLIGEGVINGEEVDVTTNKVLKLVWILIDYLQTQGKNNVALADVSALLSSSLGECVEGNDYEILADKDGRFWINHKEVGSGEPLTQWIDSVLNVR